MEKQSCLVIYKILQTRQKCQRKMEDAGCRWALIPYFDVQLQKGMQDQR